MKETHSLVLSQLQEGESGVVLSVRNSGSIRRRLRDIGLIEGTYVECVGTSPLGSPRAYRIRGAVIAIRTCESDQIIVERSVTT